MNRDYEQNENRILWDDDDDVCIYFGLSRGVGVHLEKSSWAHKYIASLYTAYSFVVYTSLHYLISNAGDSYILFLCYNFLRSYQMQQ